MEPVPWNPDEMTLEQAQQEYERVRRIRKPSTADLRREGHLVRRIELLARDQYDDALAAAALSYGQAVAGVGRS